MYCRYCLQDIETFDLEDFKYNSVNMTAFRLVDLEEPKVSDILRQMERFQPIGHAILNKTGVIQVGNIDPASTCDEPFSSSSSPTVPISSSCIAVRKIANLFIWTMRR